MSKNQDRALNPRDDGVFIEVAKPGGNVESLVGRHAGSAQTSCPAQSERVWLFARNLALKINRTVASGLMLEALASEAVADSV